MHTPCLSDLLCCLLGRWVGVHLQIWQVRQDIFACDLSALVKESCDESKQLSWLFVLGTAPQALHQLSPGDLQHLILAARKWFLFSFWTDVSWWVLCVWRYVRFLLLLLLLWFGSLGLLCPLIRKGVTQELFGVVCEALTFGEELMLTEVLWASLGLLVASFLICLDKAGCAPTGKWEMKIQFLNADLWAVLSKIGQWLVMNLWKGKKLYFF